MNPNRKTITEFAEQARIDFEVCAIARPLLANLYATYRPGMKNMEAFLDQAAELFPASNCGLASTYLQHILQAGEIIPAHPRNSGEKFGTYDNENHTFLRIGSLIVDITSDQFGGPAVYVGSLQNPWKINQA